MNGQPKAQKPRYMSEINQITKPQAIDEVVKTALPPVEVLAFDGHGQVLVARCCEGKVICREVHDRDAHRYAHGLPVLKGHSFHCAKCDRQLPFSPKPKTQTKWDVRLKKGGFTLIELLIVVAILCTLAAIALAAGGCSVSDGSRVGVVTKFSYKGMTAATKSWEGEMTIQGLRGNGNGGVSAMAAKVRSYERAQAAIERRLGRRHAHCKKCGQPFNVRQSTIRIPPAGVDAAPVAVCPKCGEDN